jgi:hypothetical protein
MKPAFRDSQVGLFDAEKFQRLKNSRELFNQIMARHLLGNMVTLFVQRSAVNLDCLIEIGRMSLDDAKRFLSNSPLINSRTLPVAHSFLKCADDAMVEQIFENTQKLALNYVNDCTHLTVNDGEEEKGTQNSSNS